MKTVYTINRNINLLVNAEADYENAKKSCGIHPNTEKARENFNKVYDKCEKLFGIEKLEKIMNSLDYNKALKSLMI